VFNPYHHTVPLFDFTKASPELNGTGVFITVDDHRFVVTAAHVLEESADNIVFGAEKEVDGTMKVEISEHEKLPVCKADAQTNKGNPQLATYKDHLDLALIDLPKRFREWLEARYTPFDLRSNKPRDGVAVVSITGWPARKNVFNRKTWEFEGGYRCFHIQTQAVEKELVRTIKGDPEIHFALRMDKRNDFFSKQTRQHYELFKLRGMSGCGVWDLDFSSVAPDFPNNAYALAGIFVEDHKGHKLAKAIRAQFLWDMLFKCRGIERHL
jgi:Trypsin-like peptidase domain